MAHHIYTTEAFVIESIPQGEANRMYLLFTRELGMIRAAAQSVRLSQSKLKSHLQDYSLSRVSLVRGKEMWRLTSAKLESNLYLEYKNKPDALKAFAHVLMLLKRLLHGEEQNEDIFAVLLEMNVFLKDTKTEEETKATELFVVLNILHALGYLEKAGIIEQFIGTHLDQNQVQALIGVRKEALEIVNRSLRETQL